jgi:hypothetical protein
MAIDTAKRLAAAMAAACALLLPRGEALAQERLPWGEAERPRVVTPNAPRYDQRTYQTPGRSEDEEPAYEPGERPYVRPGESPPRRYEERRSEPPPRSAERRWDDRSLDERGPGYGGGRSFERAEPPPVWRDHPGPYSRDASPDRTYGPGEIRDAGHRFFGRISSGLASVIEYAFQRGGRPNGYILGEEAGGAFVAGLRYGEGVLHMKDGTVQKVYWQGPSVGYDFGAEGSKTMILVYNLRHPGEIYATFGGVDGSAYLVGGVGITFQKSNDIVLAPIRSGLGLRLGANLGYLKYTRSPTWNPF